MVNSMLCKHNGNGVVYHYMYDKNAPPDGLRPIRECHLAMGKGCPPVLEKNFEFIPPLIKDYLLVAEKHFAQGYFGNIEISEDIKECIFRRYPRG